MASSITTKEDIEKVTLRCMRITDDQKLTPVLAKFLPDFIKVYLEADLANVAPHETTNPKLNAQTELITHLRNRVQNARGSIQIPAAALVAIFSSREYAECQNQQLRRVATELTFYFIQLQVQHAASKVDAVQFTQQILTVLGGDAMQMVEKTRLFVIMAWLFIQLPLLPETNQVDTRPLAEALNLEPKNKRIFLQFTLLYTIGVVADPYNHWPQVIRPLFCQQIEALKPEGLTPVQHQTRFDSFYLTSALQSQECFDACDVLPIMICASQDQQACSAGVRYSCDSWVRNQTIDYESKELERQLFQLVHAQYSSVYVECVPNFEKMNLIDKPSDNALKWFIGWIMKLQTRDTQGQKLAVVKLCLFERQSEHVHKQGLLLARQLIREDPTLTEETATQIHNCLTQVISLSTFSQPNQALSLLLIAELGSKFFTQILAADIDIALKTARDLQDRIVEISTQKHSVREDELSLTYMEALNKFRDCYEQNTLSPDNRDHLLAQIVSFLSSPEALDKENGELLYILFLYIARLDQGKLSAPLLLHSVNLKDHADIKIRKEALTQLEKFEMASAQQTSGILEHFLEAVQELFVSMQNPLLQLVCEPDCGVKVGLQTQPKYSMYLDPGLIAKVLELSQYGLKFYLAEPEVSARESLERLLLLNLNQNFSQLKSDFTKPLKLIKEYLKHSKTTSGLIESAEGIWFIHRCCQNTTDIEQRILGLKVSFMIYSRNESLFQKSDPFQPDSQWPKSHEQRMYWMYGLCMRVYFSATDLDKFSQLATEVTTGSVTPSQIEEQKFLSFCLSLSRWDSAYTPVVAVMLANFKNRQLEPNFKQRLVKTLPRIVQNSGSSELENQVVNALDEMLDYDQFQVQSCVGKCFAKLWETSGKLITRTEELMQKCVKQGVELNAKRNLVVYLYEVVNKYAQESTELRAKFVEIQQIFMRYLFDRRGVMQDLASKGLSLVYKLGNEEQKQLLIQSLQDSFSGNPQQKKEQDDEKELLIDFSASTNQEQREKLKTYKDLVRVAEELGQRDLIYQFLEVHRHNQQHQDIKNAAKGISSLLMLDDKIRGSLIKIAPKILLLTYDSNQEVQDTMRQLWSALIPVADEAHFIADRWSELLDSCVKGIKSEQWRTRQAACLCLTDLVQSQNRQWEHLSKNYRDLFLTSLGVVAGDSKDTVKQAAFKLVKAFRSFTLKFANLYSNQNLKQLREVIDTVVPLVLSDCLKSMIPEVRKYGLYLLCEIIKSSQSQNLAHKLKIQNKHEKQLVLIGNSAETMSRILSENGYLPTIVSEMILNVSSIQDKNNSYLGVADILQQDGKLKMDEQGLAELKMRYSRESVNGEILKICRSLMKQETFDQVVPTLIQVIQKANYDLMTKLTVCGFIQEMVLENFALISPQNSKKIAQAFIKVFQQQTGSSLQSMKESLLTAYAGAFGFQFKILRGYPNTVNQMITQIHELDKDLLMAKLVLYFQAVKNLPNEFLQKKEMCENFLPIAFTHKFDQSDSKLRKVSEKLWDHYAECWPLLHESLANDILTKVQESLESSHYSERVSGSQAFGEIVKWCKDETIVEQTTQKLLSVVANKYFSGKEDLLKNLTTLITQDLVEIPHQPLVEIAVSQLASPNLDQKYKNTLLKLLVGALPISPVPPLFSLLITQLTSSLEQVVANSQASLLQENQGQFFDFEAQKEEEREVLAHVIVVLELVPKVVSQGGQGIFDDLCVQFYGRTNWIVRKSILECQKKLPSIAFGSYLIKQVADCGEKYEYNLGLVSDICYSCLPKLKGTEEWPLIKQGTQKIVQLLLEKDSEQLKRNVDMIRQTIQ